MEAGCHGMAARDCRRRAAGIVIVEVPYGLRVASDCSRLEEDPDEKAILRTLELIVQDHPVSAVATELNKGGLRTRSGSYWTPVSVFNMLPP